MMVLPSYGTHPGRNCNVLACLQSTIDTNLNLFISVRLERVENGVDEDDDDEEEEDEE